MPDFTALDIPPPKNWQDFETLCCEIWKLVWKDPNAQKHGRQGQKQSGVDIFGQSEGRWAGVQCKLKNNLPGKDLTEHEIIAEVNSAKKFPSPLASLAIATTAPRDAKAQKIAIKLTTQHQKARKKLFSVNIYSWDDILEQLANYPQLIVNYCPWTLTVALNAVAYYEKSKDDVPPKIVTK